MNSLKGVGVAALLAAIVLAIRELAHAELIVLIVTIGIIAASTATYVASRQRYRRDRHIAGD